MCHRAQPGARAPADRSWPAKRKAGRWERSSQFDLGKRRSITAQCGAPTMRRPMALC